MPPEQEIFNISDVNKIITAYSKKEESIDYAKKLAESEGKDKFDDHKRAISYKKNLHFIVVIGMWVIGIIIILLVIIRAWHLATNECLHWLSDSQLHVLDSVLFSSVIFSLASRYFSYYKLFPKNKD